MNREQWLNERKKGIGASEAAAVCGVSRYKSALEIFLDKRNKLPATEATVPMEVGLLMENAVAKMYESRTGRRVIKPAPMLWSKEHKFMFANLDRMTMDRKRLVELKTAFDKGIDWGDPGTDQIPTEYILQVHHQMIVSRRDVADVPVLFGNRSFEIYTVERNDKLCRKMIALEKEFWRMVKANKPPAPNFEIANTGKMLSALYGVREDCAIQLHKKNAMLIEKFLDLKEQARAIKDEMEKTRARLMAELRGSAVGYCSDYVLTQKRIEKPMYTVPSREEIRFKVVDTTSKKTVDMD